MHFYLEYIKINKYVKQKNFLLFIEIAIGGKEMKLTEMSQLDAQEVYNKAKSDYENFRSQNLSLNMTRGKPCKEQLDLSNELLTAINEDDDFALANGDDLRNYGGWNGIEEMRSLFSEMMGLPSENIVLGNNSSLQMMYDTVAQGFTHGFSGCEPWGRQNEIKFLCPAPGYDRHFAITEFFGFKLIPIKMLETGPDMNEIERLVSNDESIKGCWCVPKYGNPTGVVFSDETVHRFAKLKPAAKDFRVFWDNAYCVHHLSEKSEELLNVYEESHKNGTEDYFFYFASTSKITLPGAGVAAMGASKNNIAEIQTRMSFQTIGPDKLNQLRHVKFFERAGGVAKIMSAHKNILAPKFDLVKKVFSEELGDLGIANWNSPKGGYFINLDVLEGCASKVVQLCKEAGLVLTPAGSSFPYGKDEYDTNIRIAPTFPPINELEKAVKVLCSAIKIAAFEKNY